jgi:hypothetical protein
MALLPAIKPVPMGNTAIPQAINAYSAVQNASPAQATPAHAILADSLTQAPICSSTIINVMRIAPEETGLTIRPTPVTAAMSGALSASETD